MSAIGPFLPRRLSLFVSAIGGLAAAPAMLSARQLMTLSRRVTRAGECCLGGADINRTLRKTCFIADRFVPGSPA